MESLWTFLGAGKKLLAEFFRIQGRSDFRRGEMINSGADTGFPEGGGVKTFTSTPPLGHCPRDVIRPPKNDK